MNSIKGFLQISRRNACRHQSTAAASSSSSAADRVDSIKSTPQRFWKDVSVFKSKDKTHLEIHLDNRPLKTINGARIVIPAENKMLATLTAREWDGQTNIIRTHALPLTSLMSRSIDALSDEQSKINLRKELLAYLDTDTTCFHEEKPWQLVKRQSDHWDPLLKWVREKYSVDIKVHKSLFSGGQLQKTKDTLDAVVSTYNPLQLAAFERAVLYSKSYIIGFALTQGHLSVDQAADASSVETLSQVDKWGEVEDSHDVQHEESRQMLGSVVIAMHRS